MKLAAVSTFIPKMISFVMEGLVPISDGAQEIPGRKPRQDLFIGLILPWGPECHRLAVDPDGAGFDLPFNYLAGKQK